MAHANSVTVQNLEAAFAGESMTHIKYRYYDGTGTMVGFGVAPQEAGIRQGLMAELGTSQATIAA